MADDEVGRICDELNDLLEAERTVLLEGKLQQVDRLFDRKTKLVDALERADATNLPNVGLLRDKLERNQALLKSAADGVRSVARRMAAIRRVREALETYDANGRRETVELKPTGTLEKRA
ncbi:MAG: flagellar biosynthesis protein FlgN [Pseudomonadota bacterium]